MSKNNKIYLKPKCYLETNNYKKPKEAFKLLHKILKKRLSRSKNYELLDVGCANGELLYFLNEKFRNIKFHGVDINDELIKHARKKLPANINLKTLDYNKKNNLKKKFDIIICSGVIQIFDGLDIFFKNIKKNSKANSIFFIFGGFNEYDYDTIIGYKNLNAKINNYQSGWNIWSIKTIKKYFKKKRVIKHRFEIKFDVKKNRKNLIRSWTIKINNRRFFTNALLSIQNQMWLEIKK